MFEVGTFLYFLDKDWICEKLAKKVSGRWKGI